MFKKITTIFLFAKLNVLKAKLRCRSLLTFSLTAATTRFVQNNAVYIPLDGTVFSREKLCPKAHYKEELYEIHSLSVHSQGIALEIDLKLKVFNSEREADIL